MPVHLILIAGIPDLSVFGKVAGFAGLALGVVFFIARQTLAKALFPRLTRNQAYSIIMFILVSMVVLSGFVIYKSFDKAAPDRIEKDPDGSAYKYSVLNSSEIVAQNVTEVFQTHQKKYQQLNAEFDRLLKKKEFSPTLCEEFSKMASSGENEYNKILRMPLNKPLNSMVYLQGTIIGGSDIRLALSYELNNLFTETVKYAKRAVSAEAQALTHIDETSDELSVVSKTEFQKWVTEENHPNRYKFAKFLATALVYKYDSSESNVTENDLARMFNEVDKSYIINQNYNDTTLYSIVGWLADKKIISL